MLVLSASHDYRNPFGVLATNDIWSRLSISACNRLLLFILLHLNLQVAAVEKRNFMSILLISDRCERRPMHFKPQKYSSIPLLVHFFDDYYFLSLSHILTFALK
jgi:hypothetical protein